MASWRDMVRVDDLVAGSNVGISTSSLTKDITISAAAGPAIGMTTVDTIALLKSTNVSGFTGGESRLVQGYYTATDGGGGVFRYNAGSSATDNGGTIIAPNTGGGRWERVLNEGFINVKWFGAKGDNAADDSPAIQAAVNYIASTFSGFGHGTLWFAAGSYRCYSEITIPHNIGIRFIGASTNSGFVGANANTPSGTSLIAKTDGMTLVHSNPGATNNSHIGPSFHNIVFADGTPSIHTAILMRLQSTGFATFMECTFVKGYKGIQADTEGGDDAAWYIIEQCHFQDCTYGFHGGTGGLINGGSFIMLGTGQWAIYRDGGAQFRIQGTKFDGLAAAGNGGIALRGQYDSIINCHFERCEPSVLIDGNTGLDAWNGHGHSVIGCRIYGAAAAGISITSAATGAQLIGNTYYFMNNAEAVTDSGVGTIRLDQNVAKLPATYSAFGAYLGGGSQSVPASTFTKLNFDTKEFDNVNEYNSTTSTFSPTTSGLYQISSSVHVLSAPDGCRLVLSAYIGSTEVSRLYDASVGAAGNASAAGSTTLQLNPGDSVTIQGFFSSALSTYSGTNPKATTFRVAKIG